MKRSIIALLLIGAIGVIAWQTFRTTEKKVATGAPIVSVNVPDFAGSELIGRAAFNDNCAACHGADAAGQDGVAPPLVHKIYEPSHHGDEAFYRAALLGVQRHHWPFGNMPAVEGITRDQVAPIIAYVRALQRANGIH